MVIFMLIRIIFGVHRLPCKKPDWNLKHIYIFIHLYWHFTFNQESRICLHFYHFFTCKFKEIRYVWSIVQFFLVKLCYFFFLPGKDCREACMGGISMYFGAMTCFMAPFQTPVTMEIWTSPKTISTTLMFYIRMKVTLVPQIITLRWKITRERGGSIVG